MRTTILIWLVWPLLLTACQSTPARPQPDENSPDFQVPVGAALVLHAPIPVPAWQDQVYFQEGRLMRWGGVNAYLPYCTLKLSAKTESERQIRADTFTVIRSYMELFYKEVRAPGPPTGIQLATARWQPGVQAGFETRDGMDYRVVAAVMELGSESQPEVTQTLCTDWGLPQERAHITVRKIRRALGSRVSLELTPEPPKGK